MEINWWELLGNLMTLVSFVTFVCAVKKFFGKRVAFINANVKTKRYYNIDVSIWLCCYEMISSVLAVLISIVLAIKFGKVSTWEHVLLKEYLVPALVVWYFYIVGIVGITCKKRESYVCNCIVNIVLGTFMYIYASVDFWFLPSIEDGNLVHSLIFILIIFLQIVLNLHWQKIRKVKYEVNTLGGKHYKNCIRIVKQDSFFVLYFENKEKVIQIPKKQITEIRHKVIEVEQNQSLLCYVDKKHDGADYYKKIYKRYLFNGDLETKRKNIIEGIKGELEGKNLDEQMHMLDGALHYIYKCGEWEQLFSFLLMLSILIVTTISVWLKVHWLVFLLIVLIILLFVLSMVRIRKNSVRGFIEAMMIEYKDRVLLTNVREKD